MNVDRCCACGFLALRDKDGNELIEVIETQRQGLNVIHPAGTPPKFDRFPLCSVLAISIQMEASNRLEDIPSVLAKHRSCKSSYAWIPGFTPKEHKKMWHEEEMWKLQQGQKQDDRAWQERREESLRKAQAEDKANDQARQDARLRSDRRVHFWTTILTSLIAAMFGAFFNRASEFAKTMLESRPAHVDKVPGDVKGGEEKSP